MLQISEAGEETSGCSKRGGEEEQTWRGGEMSVRSHVTGIRDRGWEWLPKAREAEESKLTPDASGRGPCASDSRLIFADVLDHAVEDCFVFGQEMVDLIWHNSINILSHSSLPRYFYLASAKDNEFYYSFLDILLLYKSNRPDRGYLSLKLDNLPLI